MTEITIQGVLLDPVEQPLVNTPLRLVTTVGEGDTLFSAETILKTSPTGAYDFQLVYGSHKLYVMVNRKFNLLGEVTVDSDSSSPQTINELLGETTI